MLKSSSEKRNPASAGIAESKAPAPGPPQERARAFLRNVSARLRPGGVFVGTTTDAGGGLRIGACVSLTAVGELCDTVAAGQPACGAAAAWRLRRRRFAAAQPLPRGGVAAASRRRSRRFAAAQPSLRGGETAASRRLRRGLWICRGALQCP